MFHKEDSALSGFQKNKKKAVDVPLKKSVRKQLYQRALEYYEGDERLQTLLREVFLQGNLSSRTIALEGSTKKESMIFYIKTPSSETITTTTATTLYPYEQSTQFVWMALEEKNSIQDECPTVALWAAVSNILLHPHPSLQLLLEDFTVQVPPAVSKYICRGAHLMKAGMRSLPMNTNNRTRRMVAVAVQGNPQPFAVGKLLVGENEQIGYETKGVGVEIWNTYGDDLWRQCATPANLVTTPKGGKTNSMGGGAPFQNGDYGNVGFVNGAFVYPLHSDEDEDDISDEDNEMDQQVIDPQQERVVASTDESTTPAAADDDDIPKEEATGIEEPSGPSPDDILHETVCQALVNLSKKDFPMLVTTFYSKHVLPTAEDNETTIDLRQTKYKKFGTYIKEQVASELILVGPDKNNKKNTDPGAMIVGYYKKHEDFKGMTKSLTSTATATKPKLVLVNLYQIPNHFVPLLKLNPDDVAAANANSEERRGTGMLTAPEVKKIVEAYIAQENLIHPVRKDQIQLNGSLTDAIFPPKQQKQMPTPPPAMMKRKEVVQQFTARLQPAFALVQMPASKITLLQKGTPPKIEIEVSMRQSRKFVTRIRGMEEYGIDGPVLAKDVSKRLACSATVDTEASAGRAALKKGRVEVVFQGNIVDELEALLTGDETLSSHGGVKGSDYAIPLSVLEVILRKNVPARKRKGGGRKKA